MTTTKRRARLTFRDRLSHLNFDQASKLLGKNGRKLIQTSSWREINIAEDVYLGGDLLRVKFPDEPVAGGSARRRRGFAAPVATITLSGDAKDCLRWNCTACLLPCEHVAAALSLVLERKVALGLAAPPPDAQVAMFGNDAEVVRAALAEREKRAAAERMRIAPADAATPWTDYSVTSAVSGKTYRVALRGRQPGASYCSCPDFRTNTLGTCKHVMKVLGWAKRKFTPRQLGRPYRHRRIAVHLRYDGATTLRLALPADLPNEVEAAVAPHRDRAIEDVAGLLESLRQLAGLGQDFVIFPDAEEWIQQRLHAQRIRSTVEAIRRDPARHPLRENLLKTPLLPYQLDGIAFVAGAGRAVLADEMGLGKTIQAIGVAELLAREVQIGKTLVVCPASLKSQWRAEIHRFCDRDVQLIAGPVAQRRSQYANDCFFTVCNYEQVLKDILEIEQIPWDLIVLDEGQRIKNWESKTSRVIKGLKSKFALVLSGTPLENRLDELYSVVQFIDDRRLGPGFRFFHQHRVLDEKGKLIGYQKLDELRERLRPILLRRTRDSVRLELPERTDEIIRIPPTDEQKTLHDAHMQTVAAIVRKKYLTEMDLMRLRMSLLMCRMSADSTFLVNKEKPAYSSKLERLADLFDDMADERTRKVVLFSEWTTMLDQIEPLLKQRKMQFVRLDGSVPQQQREALVGTFRNQPECRFFLTTNAGSTGLNLQAANTVINVDLPWNPAVLEQRIARAHRMGQKQPVQVFVLVTEETLEESLLETLRIKRDLALAALDAESTVDAVALSSGTDQLKARLEVLLGARPEAPVDQSAAQQAAASADASLPTERRERVAAAGGELLGAVFSFLGELVRDGDAAASPPADVVQQLRGRLDQCVEADEDGRPRISFTLPDRSALDGLAQALARLLVANPPA